MTQLTWFWIITLQWQAGPGPAAGTASGRLTAAQSAALATRSAAYTAVVDAGRRALGVPGSAPVTVLFFALAPESLDPARAVVTMADTGLEEAS